MNQVDFESYSNAEVLALYCKVMDELQRREVVHSTNNPVANLAERLACKALALKSMPESTKGYDAVDANGLKYEVKGRRPTRKNKSRQLSFIRELDKRHFDFLIGILFNENLTVFKACVVPHEIVLSKASYTKHGNAWIFHLRDEVWGISGVLDITDPLKAVENESVVSGLLANS